MAYSGESNPGAKKDQRSGMRRLLATVAIICAIEPYKFFYPGVAFFAGHLVRSAMTDLIAGARELTSLAIRIAS